MCPGETFGSQKLIRDHILQTHSYPVAALRHVVDSCSRPVSRVSDKSCPMCDHWVGTTNKNSTETNIDSGTVEEFRLHLSSHQEQLALIATVSAPQSEQAPDNVSQEHGEIVSHSALLPGTHRFGPFSTSYTPISTQGLPKFYFSVSTLVSSQNLQSRHNLSGRWLPPRPMGSNLRQGDQVWYEFQSGVTKRAETPPSSTARLYKTFSFYYNDGTIFMYPADASVGQVGDGSGNWGLPERSSVAQAHTSGYQRSGERDDDEYETDDDSIDSDDGDENRLEDWRELSFTKASRNGTTTYRAAFRGSESSLVALEPCQSLEELLPGRYLKPRAEISGADDVQTLAGELPILIALIAFSAPSSSIATVLQNSLGQYFYRSHGLPRGGGCKYSAYNFSSFTNR